MTSGEGIAVEEVATCLLCSTEGAQLYSGMRDRLFGAPGVWGFMRCPRCGLVWLNPRPVAADLHKAYQTYYTHEEARPFGSRVLRQKLKLGLLSTLPGYEGLADDWIWRQVGRVLRLVPGAGEVARMATMGLNGNRKGKLLEVGCGNGAFLWLMRKAGWEVMGVEPDPVAAQAAEQQLGIPVMGCTLPEARFPEGSFDAVVFSHVIEHVYDPVGLLNECGRVLKPGGAITVVTPNIDSIGHRHFRSSWLGLDPPRHLCLFSLKTLRTCGERAGLQIEALRSSARIAWSVWAASHAIQRKGAFSDSDLTWRMRLRGLAFQMREECARRFSDNLGEELVLIGTACSPESMRKGRYRD